MPCLWPRAHNILKISISPPINPGTQCKPQKHPGRFVCEFLMWNLTHHFNYIRKYREPRAKNDQGEQEEEQTERPALATPGERDARCLREGGIGMREK